MRASTTSSTIANSARSRRPCADEGSCLPAMEAILRHSLRGGGEALQALSGYKGKATDGPWKTPEKRGRLKRQSNFSWQKTKVMYTLPVCETKVVNRRIHEAQQNLNEIFLVR